MNKLDKQHRYPWPVIEAAVQLNLVKNLTYRVISQHMLEMGVQVSHKTIFEWVHKFGASVSRKTRRQGISYSIEETYVKCNGEWMFMYRAHDAKNASLAVFLRPNRNLISAKNYFKKNIK